ncbi:reverse transcriptase domain-containing protein [Tanacetum coccineum]
MKANPLKFKAIADLKPSRMLKEIQSLNGKLAALSRFLSKGADRLLPFFKALKSYTDKKSIQWTADAEEAFRKMKEKRKATSSNLLRKQGVIRGRVKAPKVREAHTSSRLYCQKTVEVFQAHPITVLTDKPIKQILAKPEKLGRIAKWAIELVEHDIEFKGRNTIKGKILADFLAETPSAEDKDTETKEPEAAKKAPNLESTWKLYTDEASSSDGSGAGLMLVNPEGKEYTYALRFEFKTTNNEAKYEALLAVLKKTKEILGSFDSYTMEHVRKDQNKKANTLSKLASVTFYRLAKEVLVEVLAEKSIIQKEVAAIIKEDGENWMPIQEYLLFGLLPKDPQKARKLRVEAPQYRIIDGNLYRKSYLSPWLRCVGPLQAKSIIQEVHQGSCNIHAGPRLVVSKIMKLGYY